MTCKTRCGHGYATEFAVCRHVWAGCKVDRVVPPTEKHLGQILCVNAAHNQFEFSFCCRECAVSEGWMV